MFIKKHLLILSLITLTNNFSYAMQLRKPYTLKTLPCKPGVEDPFIAVINNPEFKAAFDRAYQAGNHENSNKLMLALDEIIKTNDALNIVYCTAMEGPIQWTISAASLQAFQNNQRINDLVKITISMGLLDKSIHTDNPNPYIDPRAIMALQLANQH